MIAFISSFLINVCSSLYDQIFLQLLFFPFSLSSSAPLPSSAAARQFRMVTDNRS